MESESSSSGSSTTSDLYFLIVKFLAGGPCNDIAEALRGELERRKILPPRIDWQGNEHEQSFEEMESKFQHLGPNHLLDLCQRLGPLLSQEQQTNAKWSLLQPLHTQNNSILKYSARYKGLCFQDPVKRPVSHNVVRLIQGRENNNRLNQSSVLTPKFYARQQLFCKTLGHLSSVYCVLFDKTGRYVFTGADDLLVKVWSVHTGRLLATLRGASSEITDIDVNPENTLLAAGSCDKILRVWCLQTTAPVAVLSSHTGMITSVNFCPHSNHIPDAGPVRYLVSTSTDGSVAFWSYEHRNLSKYVKFQPKPIQYHERMRPGQAQMICAGFSPGGAFLAAGSADHHVRVYQMSGTDGPTRILEKEAHSDRVDSIQWSTSGLRFISGSKDGTALIWRYEAGDWHYVSLNMYTRLPGTEVTEEEAKQRLKVSMVAWAMKDQWVITAVNDYKLKVWDSTTGALCHVMTGHRDEVFVLEPHPVCPSLLLSAGHDGQIILWDISTGTQVRSYTNTMDGQGHGAVFDTKWSPDGTMAAATDSHGHLLLFGLGTNEKYRSLPKQLFFHTDYRPLIRDVNHWVLDEQTQIAPHLMPPPFLVDVDGNPYPPALQRLVPGREGCQEEQLVPNIIVTDDGDQEVIEGLPEPEQVQAAPVNPVVVAPNPAQAAAAAALARMSRLNSTNQEPSVQPARSNIDEMIEALARASARQAQAGPSQRPSPSPAPQPAAPAARPVAQPRAPIAPRNQTNRVGPRLSGDVEGVRQSRGNWQGNNELGLTKKSLIPLAHQTTLDAIKVKYAHLGQSELNHYSNERCKPPLKQSASPQVPKRSNKRPINRTNRSNDPNANMPPHLQLHNYRLRFAGGSGVPDEVVTPSSSDEEQDDGSTVLSSSDCSDSSDDSSEYSDWVADTGANLEPPKRSRRKPVVAAKTRSSQDDQSEEEEDEAGPSNEAGPSTAGPSRRDSRLRQAPKKTKRPDETPSPQSSAANAAKIVGPKKELPEAYRPSEWLSEVIPRKAPYYPQMGDEVMYFRQGHEQYLNAVRTKKVYELGPRCEPWLKRKGIRDQELVKVIGIKYEIRPPRLCCLKLALLNSSTNAMTSTFTIKYHDMPDVLDFLVLKQTYDSAMSRNWKLGDQFRCMIDDSWWIGTIESHEPFESDFPDSAFQCFQVRWDNGEYEKMSPWDLEPVDTERLPAEIGGAVPILPAEIQATLYQSKPEDWPPEGDRDGECQRILSGIEQVMTLSAAEPFAAPVDLNQYPTYAVIVEYPIDLTMIKSRLENHFYRRVTSVQYDVRFIATNAEKFNQKGSGIVKQARIVTELCLSIIKGHQATEVSGIYHQMMDNYKSDSESSEQEEDDDGSDGSDGAHKNARARAVRRSTRSIKRSQVGPARPKRAATVAADPSTWKIRCRDMLDVLWHCGDSQPFREPVDCIEHPDYIQLIDTPMDLGTVREELFCGNYETPLEFAKDMRLIFNNSKNYNTNKKSRIYGMTVRLSMMFETRMKNIIEEWKQAKRRSGSSSVSPNRPVRRAPKTAKARAVPARPKAAVRSTTSQSTSSNSRCSSATSSSSTARPARQTNGIGVAASSRRPIIHSSPSEEEVDVEDVKAVKPALAEPPEQPQPSTSASTSNGTPSSTVQKIVIKKSNNGSGLETLVANGHMWSPTRPKRGAKRLATSSEEEEESDEEEQEEGPAQASTADSGASTGAAEPEPSDKDPQDESGSDAEEEEEEEAEVGSSELGSENSEEEYQQSEDSSEDEDEMPVQRPRRKRARKQAGSSDSEDSNYSPMKKTVRTRSKQAPKKGKKPVAQGRTQRKRQKVCYQEEDSDEEQQSRKRSGRKKYTEDSDESSDNHREVLSISSRGRVRKITERARGIFKD